MSQESKAPLFDRSIGKFVEATFVDGLTWDHIQEAQDSWSSAVKTLIDLLQSAKIPRGDWPEHLHWNWRWKALQAIVENQEVYGLRYENLVQGLMMLKPEAKSKMDPASKLVYVEYLSAAPWNLDVAHVQQGRFKQIGRVLFAAAVQLSREAGFQGRVGLYALPQAVSWYEELGTVEIEEAKLNKLRYFELTPGAADAFLPE